MSGRDKDEHDLTIAPEGASDLSLRGTVSRFAKRVSRDIGDLEKEREDATLLREERQKILDKILESVDSDLKEVTHVDLGSRYRLFLNRVMSTASTTLRLSLLDKAKEREEALAFEILIENRERDAALQFGEEGESPETFMVTGEDCIRKLNLRLRRSLRNFFDRVQSYLADPVRLKEASLLEDRKKVEMNPDILGGASVKDLNTSELPRSNAVKVEPEEVLPLLDVDLESDY